MRLVVAGSRDLTLTLDELEGHVREAFGKTVRIDEVVSGACPTGIDACGEAFARRAKIPVRRFPADWSKNGKAAGPMRNVQMAHHADAGIVFMRRGKPSPGSMSMAKELRRVGKSVKIVYV